MGRGRLAEVDAEDMGRTWIPGLWAALLDRVGVGARHLSFPALFAGMALDDALDFARPALVARSKHCCCQTRRLCFIAGWRTVKYVVISPKHGR